MAGALFRTREASVDRAETDSRAEAGPFRSGRQAGSFRFFQPGRVYVRGQQPQRPGPRVGEALTFLSEARAVGDVTDRDEARAALRRFAAARGWTDRSEP